MLDAVLQNAFVKKSENFWRGLKSAEDKPADADPKGRNNVEVYFVLDEQGDPLPVSDTDAWLQWFDSADRRVGQTMVTPDIAVLTIFSGVDEVTEGRAPRPFETRVFGGVLDGEEVRYPTRVDAVAGHAMVVASCRLGTLPGEGVTEKQIT